MISTLLAAAAASAVEITTKSVVDEMNVRRAKAGLAPLREDSRLSQAADDRMRDMEEQGYWNHSDPQGRSPFQWLRPRGYDFSYAGENLASGFETAEIMVDGWMESKGHRENILSPFYSECGVSIIDGATTGRATGRSVVVLFARPRAITEPPSPDPRRVSTPAFRR
jgi:uncharacterized protein YkwD